MKGKGPFGSSLIVPSGNAISRIGDSVFNPSGGAAFTPESLSGFHAAYDTLTSSVLFTDVGATTPATVSGTDRVRAWKTTYTTGEADTLTNANGGLYRVVGGVPTCELHTAGGSREIIEATLVGGAQTRTAFTTYWVARRTEYSNSSGFLGYLHMTARDTGIGFSVSAGGLQTRAEKISGDNVGGVGGTPDLNWHVYAMSYSAANGVRLFLDGGEVSPTGGTLPPGPQAGMANFSHNAYGMGFPAATDTSNAALYGYTAEHSVTQIRQMTSYLRMRFGGLMATASNPLVIWTGASNFMDVQAVSGGNQVLATSVPWKSAANTSSYTKWYSGARPNQRTDQERLRISDELAQYAQWHTGHIIFCHFSGGADKDIPGGTAADIYAQLTAYVSDLRVAIPGCKVVLGTYLPRASFDNVIRAALNVLIVANTAGADAIADWASNTTIGEDGDNTNTTYYDADQIHLLDAGTTIGYPYWLDEIEALLA